MAENITSRAEDYSKWYTDIVLNAKLADYSPVKGCMIIRPNGYAIWEKMQAALDKMFKDTGHENAYFPIMIPESFMKKEAEHVEGFSPECAIVTIGGGKELEERLYLRPTSETIIWSTYAKWIMSYRDLPILINQWANIIRWEMRTRLFLRTTEFLWQEGHTAHSNAPEAEEEVSRMLNVYAEFAEKFIALPVIKGKKTESEKFAGAIYTVCIEAMMQDRKALQSGTSHYLGQNFAKAFDVTFLNQSGERELAYATSWGVSTRLIGALIMAHSDDNGLVLPPKLATVKAVIVPIWKSDEERNIVLEYCKKIEGYLKEKDINYKLDDRDQYKPGYKFSDWEMQGIPVRIEVGPKDIQKNAVVLFRRDTMKKEFGIPLEKTGEEVLKLLDDIQNNLFNKALEFRKEFTFFVNDYEEFKKKIEDPGGFLVSHWCESPECEEKVKEETKASIRCIPFDEELRGSDGKCIVCGKPAPGRVVFAKAY
ncbi:MAG: proline--tRNA ligase [bacterium]|nr:proline--tRNA ligase [bacterium]